MDPRSLPARIDSDAHTVERDLMRLVLTVVELIRQLMEKQAIRRVDEGDLKEGQIEALGLGLKRLEAAMAELRERYALTPADLQLDLGPLNSLLEGAWLETAETAPGERHHAARHRRPS